MTDSRLRYGNMECPTSTLLTFDDSWMDDIPESCNQFGEFRDDQDVTAKHAEVEEEEAAAAMAEAAADDVEQESANIAELPVANADGPSKTANVLLNTNDSMEKVEYPAQTLLTFDDSWMDDIPESCNQFGEFRDDQDVTAKHAEIEEEEAAAAAAAAAAKEEEEDARLQGDDNATEHKAGMRVASMDSHAAPVPRIPFWALPRIISSMHANRPFLLSDFSADLLDLQFPIPGMQNRDARKPIELGGCPRSLLEALRQVYGEEIAPVTRCAPNHTPQGNGEETLSSMPVHDFVTGLEKKCEHRSGRIAGMEGTEEVRVETVEPSKDHDDFLYLKDWHFARCSVRLANRKCKQAEEDGEDVNPFTGFTPYAVPLAFCDDWLNWWCDLRMREKWQSRATKNQRRREQRRQVVSASSAGGLSSTAKQVPNLAADETRDYRFLYMGAAGTWTPMHHDVLNSYSWSVNLVGRKRWIFFPPGTEPMQGAEFSQNPDHVAEGSEADFHVSSQDGGSNDVIPDVRQALLRPRNEKIQHCSEALRQHCMRHAIVVNQGPLEPIFVPSGWHHQVENLSSPLSPVVVSINHNWFNGFSLRKVVSFLLSEFNAVTRELKHLDDGSFVASSSSSSDEVDNSTNEDSASYGGSEQTTPALTHRCNARNGGKSKKYGWEKHCEKILRANCGLSLSELVDLLRCRIAFYDSRIAALSARSSSSPCEPPKSESSENWPTSSTGGLDLQLCAHPNSTPQNESAAILESRENPLPQLRLSSPIPVICSWSPNGQPRADAEIAELQTWADNCLNDLWKGVEYSVGADDKNDDISLRVIVHSLLEILHSLSRIACYEDAARHIFDITSKGLRGTSSCRVAVENSRQEGMPSLEASAREALSVLRRAVFISYS